MRVLGLVVTLMLVSSSAPGEPLRAAVFDLELLDTSLQGEMKGPQADEQRRLKDVSEQLRKGLADAGKFVVIDIAPVNAAAHASNLQACAVVTCNMRISLVPISLSPAWCRRSLLLSST